MQIFNHEEFSEVRTVVIDDKPYAVGNDVAKALGYVKPRNAVSDHCKGALSWGVIDSLGREQETKVIPEEDIYRLIVKAADQSKSEAIKKKAQIFETWIFDDVLPSIRKHGAYVTKDILEEVLANPDFGIRLLEDIKKERNDKEDITGNF